MGAASDRKHIRASNLGSSGIPGRRSAGLEFSHAGDEFRMAGPVLLRQRRERPGVPAEDASGVFPDGRDDPRAPVLLDSVLGAAARAASAAIELERRATIQHLGLRQETVREPQGKRFAVCTQVQEVIGRIANCVAVRLPQAVWLDAGGRGPAGSSDDRTGPVTFNGP